MKVEIFTLCDNATIPSNPANKLDLVGIFDHIYSSGFPYIHPGFTLAVRVRFDAIESGQRNYRIELIDADGRLLVPAASGMLPRSCWEEMRSEVSNLIVRFRDIGFPRVGDYEARIAIDGRLEACAPFRIVGVPTSSLR